VDYLQISLNYSIYNLHIGLITQENIIGFLDWCKNDKKNAVATLNNRLSALKTFFTYLMTYKDTSLVTSANKIADLHKRQGVDCGPHEYLSQQQMKILFSIPERNTFYGLRDLLLIALLYDSACRIDEILSLKLKEIIYSKDLCYINVTGKGRKSRNLPLGKTVELLISEYLEVFHRDKMKDNYLFYVMKNNSSTKMSQDNVSRILKKYEFLAKQIDPSFPHLHSHILRHTRSQHWYDAGINLEDIALLLGHSQLTTSLTYTFFTVNRKKVAIEKALGNNELCFISEKEIILDEETIKKLYGL
jgi:site-specific recombinase XerD